MGDSVTLQGSLKHQPITVNIVKTISSPTPLLPCTEYEVEDSQGTCYNLKVYSCALNASACKKSSSGPNEQKINDLKELAKTLNAIEKELSSLMKLDPDETVVYHGYKILRSPTAFTVYLLQTKLDNVKLSYYLDKEAKIKEPVLKCIANCALRGLSYLHENDVVHRYLDNILQILLKQLSYSITNKSDECICWKFPKI